MLEQNTRESAIRREEFHRILQAWLDDSFDERIGEPDSHAGPAWLWVRHGGEHFHLNAESSRDGIRRYLQRVASSRGDPEWSTTSFGAPGGDRVAVGTDRLLIDGFEFYRQPSGR